MPSPQLQLETSRPVTDHERSSPSLDEAGREELSFPTDKATAAFFASSWRRRGLDVDVEKRGRLWVVVEA